jgi:serine phosphatase RsbU (regulator of sigma subunit)
MREGARDPFTDDDVALALDVADRLGVGLHNALQYEAQVQIAVQLQQSLLPRALPEVPGLDLAGSYWAASRTADVGGDLYDVFAIDDGRWAVLIGDVSGKGIDAAVLTALVRHTARAAARHTGHPTEVLRWVNDAFSEQGFESSEMFCTAVFGVCSRDRDGFEFTFALAGHPQPVVVDRHGTARREGELGQAIGIFPDIELRERTVALRSGDVVMLFTDGVTDVPGDTALDEDSWTRVVGELVAHPDADSAASIARLAEEWLARRHASAPERDDVALLVLRVGDPLDRAGERPVGEAPQAGGG